MCYAETDHEAREVGPDNWQDIDIRGASRYDRRDVMPFYMQIKSHSGAEESALRALGVQGESAAGINFTRNDDKIRTIRMAI
jgi:hypothetical protein